MSWVHLFPPLHLERSTSKIGMTSQDIDYFFNRPTTVHNKVNAQNYMDFRNHLLADLKFKLNEIQRRETYTKHYFSYSFAPAGNFVKYFLLIFSSI